MKTATVGDTQRDPRYAKFMSEPFTEGQLVRLGLRAPTTMAPLQQQGTAADSSGAPAATDGSGPKPAGTESKDAGQLSGDVSG